VWFQKFSIPHPWKGLFSNTSPPLWKFQLSFVHFFKFFGLPEPFTPQEIQIPSVGRVWIFFGTAHYLDVIASLTYFELPDNIPVEIMHFGITYTYFNNIDVFSVLCKRVS